MTRSSAFVLGAVLGLAPIGGIALAGTTPAVAADEAVAEGAVKSVDAKAGTFVITVGGKEITVKTSKDTKYMRDGKDAKMEEIVKAGAYVKVTHKDATASKVEAGGCC